MTRKISMAFLIILIIALAVAGFVYLKDRAVQNAAEEAALKEREAWQHKNQLLEKKLGGLEKNVEQLGRDLQLAEQAPPLEPDRRLQVFGDNGTGMGLEPSVHNVHRKVMKFFGYLDQKGYLSARGIGGTSYEHFKSITDRLMLTSPVISGESQDMLTLLKNITYLFNTLGKNDTLLVRDILNGESEIMEPTMKLFSLWMDPSNTIEGTGRITLPFEKQYEYAAYFMQTIGGKAYLFRRDAKMRLLMSYYSILIIDRANQESLNTYGVDLRPLVGSLITEIQNSKILADKQEYIATLNIIKKKSEGIKIERPKMDELPLQTQPE
jgi:hypothetical protein